jgi:predicted dehydrogenase
MVTVSILGAGFMGGAHAANYRALGDSVRVKTVCGRSADRTAKVAESVGAEHSTDLAATIADPEIDAIDICLPTPLHRTVAVQALDAGKHVFLEKPIALTMADADAIVEAAARSGRILMVGDFVR